MKKHHFHPIQKGDTLQSVSKQYGISAEELRRYHNTYCELGDLLNSDIEHQKELFVPKRKQENGSDDDSEEVKKKVLFAPDNKLIYAPSGSHYKYGVMITIEDGENKNEIKYEASAKWIQKYGSDHIFEIDRISKIYINEEEANDIADLLAYETSKVLFPMFLRVDPHGNWEEVAKYNKYPERWKTVKEHLLKTFDGEIVVQYFQKIEKILETPEQVNFYMLGDFFLRTLFFGYCMEQGKEQYITFPIVENGIEPRYRVQTKVNPYLDEYNLINVEIEGALDDERSMGDFINGNLFSFEETDHKDSCFGTLSLQAFLNPYSCIPEAIHLECSILLENIKKVTVVVGNLSETKSIMVRSRETIAEGREPEKLGFWGGVKEFFKEMNDPDYFEEKHRKHIKQQMKK